MAPHFIRSLGTGGSFEKGDQVEANYGGKGRWYKGVVDRVNNDGTYSVAYDDGDSERSVPARFVRKQR